MLSCVEDDLVLRGMRSRICRWGTQDGPLALLLHGWLDQGAAFERVAAPLAAAGWQVVAPDHRGHGRSAHVPAGTSYHFTDYIVDVDALVHHLGRPPAVLMGHSMGGTLASLYAGLRPDGIEHVILLEGLGPAAMTPGDAADQLAAHLDAQRAPRQHRPMSDVDQAAERLRRLNPGLGTDLAQALAERTTGPHPDGGVVWTWDAMHRTRAAVAYDQARHMEILGRIRAPVTVAFGTRSWYLQLPDLDARLAHISDLRHRVSMEAGHALHIDQGAAVAALVTDGPRAAATTTGEHPFGPNDTPSA